MFHPNGEIEPVRPAAPLAADFEQPPPRRLSPVVARRVRKNSRKRAWFSLLFGGIFMLVGLPISLVFFPWRIVDSAALYQGPTATAPGSITSVERTSYNVNHRQVNHFSYSFEAAGRQFIGECYFAGGNYAPGCPVQVRYLVSRPALNCVEGGTLDPAGNFVLFVVMFPIVGVGFFGYGLWAVTVGTARSLDLARNGFVAEGRVTDVTQTNLRVNRQYRYEIAVEYDAMGPQRTTYYAYGEDVERARQWMSSAAVVHVLYDRNRPDRAAVVEQLLA